MSKRLKAAFVCHWAALLILAAFGLAYFLRTQFMPYHATATGMQWDQLSPGVQALILGLMKAVGGACLGVVVLEAILLLIPFRQGARWARWAIPAGGLVVAGAALYAMIYVGLHTPAKPPWIGPAAGGVLLLGGLLLSLERDNKPR